MQRIIIAFTIFACQLLCRVVASADAPSCNATLSSLRSIDTVLPRPDPFWVGDGFHVYPVFADKAFTNHVTPMLMLDYAAPKTFPPRPDNQPPLGVDDHPHGGVVTVTVLFQGQLEHHDSTGNTGVIGPGDVQWMTSGRGIVHKEYHSKEFNAKGGTMELCQLFVNLPKKHKWDKPSYHSIEAKEIPTVALTTQEDGTDAAKPQARVIAGELLGVKGPANPVSPINLWDVSLPNEKTTVEIPYPANHTCMVFVRRGAVAVDQTTLNPQDLAIMMKADEKASILKIQVLEDASSVLIMGGEPINEPIVSKFPFFAVNTEEELLQIDNDFRAGKFGLESELLG